MTYLAHHIRRTFSKFQLQHISQHQTNAMLASDGALQLDGTALKVGDDFLGSGFLVFTVEDGGVEVA